MPYAPDLANTGPVKEVGYLWFGHSYPKGKIEKLVLEPTCGDRAEAADVFLRVP